MVFLGPRTSNDCSFELGGTDIEFANSAVILGFAAQPGLCALATDPCTGRKNFPFVWGLVATAVLGGAAQPVATGPYTVYADITSVPFDPLNPTAPLRAAVFQGERTDATCLPVADPPVASGTIRIDAVGATEVRGEIDITFADGQEGFLRGPFTAAPVRRRGVRRLSPRATRLHHGRPDLLSDRVAPRALVRAAPPRRPRPRRGACRRGRGRVPGSRVPLGRDARPPPRPVRRRRDPGERAALERGRLGAARLLDRRGRHADAPARRSVRRPARSLDAAGARPAPPHRLE